MGEELRAFIEKRVSLEEAAWQEMQAFLKVKELKRKDHFLKQGEVCRHIGFIVKGYVRLYFLVDGEEVTKDFNFENAFCGSYASFSLQQPSRFNVVAMENTTLYLLGRDELFSLYEKYPSMQKFGRLAVEHMFIRKELREASFLLDSAEERYHQAIANEPQLLQRVPLKYLASYLGVTAETVSRIRAGNT